VNWTIVTQVALGLVPLGVAWIAYWQATKANKATVQQVERQAQRQEERDRSKVDAEAFERARAIYEAALEQLERQLSRVQEQFDRVNRQLGTEQATSHALRGEIKDLQRQVEALERTVEEHRRQLIAAGLDPSAVQIIKPPEGAPS